MHDPATPVQVKERAGHVWRLNLPLKRPHRRDHRPYDSRTSVSCGPSEQRLPMPSLVPGSILARAKRTTSVSISEET